MVLNEMTRAIAQFVMAGSIRAYPHNARAPIGIRYLLANAASSSTQRYGDGKWH